MPMAVDTETLLESVARIESILREHAAEAESRRRLSGVAGACRKGAGLYLMWIPRTHGELPAFLDEQAAAEIYGEDESSGGCAEMRVIRGRGALARVLLSVGFLLGFVGCASFGGPSIDRDRFDYVNAVASSWKQQTLLNIVKMRYADTPVFLEVGQIIAGYQLEGTVSLGAIFNGALDSSNLLSLGTAARYTDRPTITYAPLMGAHFIQVMMTPIPPPALFRLIESGWPVDRLLQLTAQSINGVSNSRGGARSRAADPEFAGLLAAFQRIQASGAIGLRVEVSEKTRRAPS